MLANHNPRYYETSALTGDNIEEMFSELFYSALALKFSESGEKPEEEMQ